MAKGLIGRIKREAGVPDLVEVLTKQRLKPKVVDILMPVTDNTRKVLWMRYGNRCAVCQRDFQHVVVYA